MVGRKSRRIRQLRQFVPHPQAPGLSTVPAWILGRKCFEFRESRFVTLDRILIVASGTSKISWKEKKRYEWLKPGAWGCKTKGAATECAEAAFADFPLR